ncbi:D-alanyl-D-alanine carboxypeptidase/D-alanyl-D-alanine-endopeptidase [Allokutzneria sp. A3M-2-11 16]|uniref:D-alanyl-D-alanine carboxypeptidase/D-alanyl-D-alanine endopeptidase n=1 Tax=Allokutzneria sp. A3M-2-11 16 TaxID=2962043 RepID=UPI0020B76BC6|nr:D-alanyl-D-alanine carboxypeptidase/D-alanyl-D-alanine-endopeptidase [Allokutzneria sp. A3M-2-11 16]MCP3797651.1 D-alanyl-D-alanine carboxypeptidase/D-alanyl-D-alanine-endopeptidase [Allokutzneria sp. A3M-2-11 16]
MRWRFTSGVVAVLLVGLVSGSAQGEPTGQDALRQDLDRILAAPALNGAHFGLVVRKAAGGEVLYSRGATGRLNPASNGKLLSSAAALETLGAGHRFTTEVLTSARTAGGVLLGDLHLRGTGDPTLREADLNSLADQLARAGIKVVTGRVVADDSWFDSVRLGTGWAWDDEPYYYSAQISALTLAPNADFDAGTVLVQAQPGAVGKPAQIRLSPATSVVTVDNRTVSAAPGTPNSLSVEREHGGSKIVVTGTVAAPAEDYSTVDDPTAYTTDVFTKALAAKGINVIRKDVGRGATPAGAKAVATHSSMTLAELIVPFMKLSNNMHAEALVKAMGRKEKNQGTWAAGLEVMSQKLAGMGMPANAYRMVDGSGLSRFDLITAEQLGNLLVSAQSKPWFAAWYESLPIAGKPDRMVGGTLRNRMKGTPAEGNVHAKTGSLTSVTGLSGYVTAANGEKLVFASLMNNYLTAKPSGIEDAIVVRLANYRGAADRSLPIPAPRSAGTPNPHTDLECTWTRTC